MRLMSKLRNLTGVFPQKEKKTHVPLSVWQKLAWSLVIVIALFGVCVTRGGKIVSSASASSSCQNASSADVLAAEERLKNIKKSIEEENERKDMEKRMARDRFRRSQDEVRKLREELDGVK